MRGFRVQGSLFMVVLIFILICIVLPVGAVDSTPSAKQASPSGSLIDKINELKSEVASKVAVLKLQINKKLQNKVYLGLIKNISEKEVDLENPKGARKILLNAYTVYQSDAKKVIKNPKLSDIFKEELKGASSSTTLVAALGDVDDKNILTAKKVIKFNSFKGFPMISFTWGQVKSNNASSITIVNKDGKDVKILVSQNIDTSQIQANKYVVVSGELDEDQDFNADFIYIIEGSMLKPNTKSASPSASTKKL